MKNLVKAIVRAIHSVIAWPLFIVIFCSHMCISALLYLFLRKPYVLVHKLSAICLRTILFIGGVETEIKGLERIPKSGPFVLMANHQSLVDIPIILMSLPRYGCFIAKKELKRVPFLGFSMIFQGHFFIDRQNPKQAIRDMDQIGDDVIKRDVILLVFPEGTRSKDGYLADFKLGSFKVATQKGIRFFHVELRGLLTFCPKRS